MHLTYFLFIVVFLIPLARALFNETSSVKSINSAAELAEAYFGVEYLTAFLYYCGNSRSEFLAPFYQEFAEANKEFYRFYAVDCDLIQNTENNEIIPACQEEFRDSLPQIFFIEPNEELPDETSDKIPAPKYHRYEGDIAVEDFEKFAKKLMPSFAEKLVSLEDLDKFLANQPELNKVLFLANKKSLPQYWKALTAHYRDRLSFGEVFSKGTEIFEKFNVARFPTIIILRRNETGWKEIVYKGDYDLRSLKKQLKKFAAEKKPETRRTLKVEKSLDNIEDDPVKESDVTKIVPDNFEDLVYGTEGLVLIHLFSRHERHRTFADIYSKYHEIIDIYDFNCTEARHKNFCENKLQVKSLPAYRLYPIGNKEIKSKSKIIFSRSKKLKEIRQEISDVVANPMLQLDSKKLNFHQQSVNITRKPSLIFFHDKDEISLSLRVLAQLNPYKHSIRFGSYHSPSEEIKKQFSVDSLPKIVVVFVSEPDRKDISINDGILTAKFNGNLSLVEIRHFLNTVINN